MALLGHFLLHLPQEIKVVTGSLQHGLATVAEPLSVAALIVQACVKVSAKEGFVAALDGGI